jgi:putative FmdB family regulatory protein
MPTYEYVCVDCANRFEVSHPIGDEAPSVCEICGGKLRRVFHPIGIVLKGSGFYRTESRSKPKEPVSEKKESAGKKEPSKTPADTSSSSSEKQEKSA